MIPTPRTAVRQGRDTNERLDLLEGRIGLLPDRLSTSGAELTDWNEAISPGFYWSVGAANSPIPDDAGSGSWWSGLVYVHPGDEVGPRIFQEAREARGAQSGRVFRRYYNGTSWQAWELADGIRRGTGARRLATTPRYWDFWQDTDGSQLLYVGSKSGTWRQFSGNATSPAAAWSTSQGTAPAAVVVGRSDTLTIDTVLEANETLRLVPTSIGNGFGNAATASVTKNLTNTSVVVRMTQIGSATTQQFTFSWEISQYT